MSDHVSDQTRPVLPLRSGPHLDARARGAGCSRPAAAALVVSLMIAACGATAAEAAVYCDVQVTTGRFADLRAAPARSAKLVARMRRGDEVQVRDDVAARGDWLLVVWWKGGRFKVKRTAGYDPPNGEGWVRKVFIAEECG